MTFTHFFVGALLALACISDVRTRRIPNALTFSAVATAVVFHLLTGGWSAAGWSFAGCLLGALLFFPMFALRGMGAGDVKLLAAVGAWLGPGAGRGRGAGHERCRRRHRCRLSRSDTAT